MVARDRAVPTKYLCPCRTQKSNTKQVFLANKVNFSVWLLVYICRSIKGARENKVRVLPALTPFFCAPFQACGKHAFLTLKEPAGHVVQVAQSVPHRCGAQLFLQQCLLLPGRLWPCQYLCDRRSKYKRGTQSKQRRNARVSLARLDAGR